MDYGRVGGFAQTRSVRDMTFQATLLYRQRGLVLAHRQTAGTATYQPPFAPALAAPLYLQ